MATKLYLHAAASTVGGTLPASNASISATSPTQIGDSGTNRTMNPTIGASQTSVAITTNGTANAQPSLIARFLTTPLASQTFALTTIGDIAFQIAGSESNAGSNFQVRISLATWRPSTGAVVTRIFDLATNATAEPGTSQTALSLTNAAGGTSATVADQDILVLEVWRDSTTPGATTARTNTIFYDGTTEGSTTSQAAFVNFPNDTLKFLGTGFGQAQAKIKGIGQGYAQSTGLITRNSADTYVLDTFTRSVTAGVGSANSGGAWTIASTLIGAANYDVNGSQLVFSALDAGQTHLTGLQSYLSPTENNLHYIEYNFATIPSSGSINLRILGGRGNQHLETVNGWGGSITIANTTGAITVSESFDAAAGDSQSAGTYVAGETWALKAAIYKNNGIIKGFAKTWKVGTAEPAWQSEATTSQTLVRGHNSISVNAATGATTLTLDNYQSYTYYPQGYGQAQASIKAIGRGFGQAQATMAGGFPFVDTFTRSTSGMGTADNGDVWTRVSGANDTGISTDGSKLVITNVTSTRTYDIPTGSGGMRGYEFYIKDISFSSGIVSSEFAIGTQNTSNTTKIFGLYITTDSGNIILNRRAGTGFSQLSSQAYTNNDLWSAKLQVVQASNNAFVSRWKLWKTANGETGWSSYSTVTTLTDVSFSTALRTTFVTASAVTINVAEIQVTSAAIFASGQAQATILTGYAGKANSLDPLLYMRLGETVGNFFDYGSGLTFALSGSGSTRGVTGYLKASEDDGALQLANSGFIDVNGANSATFPVGAAVRTIIGWVTTASSGEVPIFVYGRNDLTNGWVATFLDNGVIKLFNGTSTLSWGSGYNDNVTHMIAFVYNSTAWTVYVDGVFISTQAQTINTVLTSQNAWIGTTGSSFATGILDEIELVAAAVSGADISALYALGAIPRGYGQAQALIFSRVWYDTFSRTTLNTFDKNDAGYQYYDSSVANNIVINNDYLSSDPLGIVNTQSALLGYTDGTTPKVVQFDFYVHGAGLTITVKPYGGFGVNIDNSEGYGAWISGDTSYNSISFSPTPGDWWTAKAYLNQTSGHTRLKVWARGTLEPTWNSESVISNPTATTLGSISFNSTTGTRIDNVIILEVGAVTYTLVNAGQAQASITGGAAVNNGFGQSQADIKAIGRGFGQAQADIKQIGQGFGQSQADIKAIGYGFAQSQADIKAINYGFGQSQADIKQTYIGAGQAQADIKAVGYGFGQAQSDINAIGRGFGQAQATILGWAFGQSQADIKAIGRGFAQSQADIKAVGQGYGQSQADIKAVGYGFGQSNADIKAINYGFGQSQADIKQLGYGFGQAQACIKGNAFAQAQADIKATNYGFGQAQSDIKATGFGFGQAQGSITNTGYGSGQAQSDIKTTYQEYGQAQSDIKQTYQQYAQSQADVKSTYNGFGQAQATIQGNAFGQAQGDIKQIGYGFAQAQADVKQTYNQFAQTQADIKQTYQQFAQAQADVKQIGQGYGQSQADILTQGYGFGQSQADIKQTYVGCGQAQAEIKQTYQQYAQANADIKQVGYGSGQAQASILGRAYGQAQGDIKQTYQSYGQAQGYIQFSGTIGCGQAQGSIKQTYNNFAQAQAEIKQTYQGYSQAQGYLAVVSVAPAQSQGTIRATYQGYGQAQGTIKSVTSNYGQAQGTIKQTYQSYGQAQATIKQTYQGYAQANAYIKIVRINCSGQAQGTIKATSNAYGQSQANILQTYNKCAQAQALIKTTINSYGQAQAVITTNYYGSGQAQGAVTSGTAGYGQAQALIQTTVECYAQAQALISKSAGYAQAQALVKIEHFLKTFVIGDRSILELVLEDRARIAELGLTSDSASISLDLNDRAF